MFARKFNIPRKDLLKIKDNGILLQSSDFGALVVKRQILENPRFAVVISTKVSKLATHRNRIKRAFRDALRYNWKKVSNGIDIVFLVKPSSERVGAADIMKEIQNFLENTRMLKKTQK
ncbi:MAG TPA: ribonuclease P protein component [Patescibacteria group bacterium]|nr:ribonuclease P protein component [Patescibacteria group bacterium]